MKTSRPLLLAATLLGLVIGTLGSGRVQAAGPLEITAGSWGYAGERKNVKDDIAKLCDGKTTCSFKAANDTFPTAEPKDPSPGNRKGLLLRWKCGEVEGRDQIPEHRSANLKCP